MPQGEDSLAPEGVLGLDDVLSEVLTVVADLSPHVVDKEGLRKVEFIVRVRHRLEVKSHGGTALDITDLERAGSRVAVNIEELGDLLAVLGEKWVGASLLPLLVEVHHVVGLRGEQATELLVGEHLIKHIDLINGRLSTLVSDARGGDKGSRDEVDLPERSVCEHHEGEATVSDEHLSPHIVRAVEARADLVKVVTSTHAPFPVVGVHHVGDIRVLGRVTLGLSSLGSLGTVVRRISTDVVSIATLRGLETHVVIAWLIVLAEAELRSRGQEGVAARLLNTSFSKVIEVYLRQCERQIATFLISKY